MDVKAAFPVGAKVRMRAEAVGSYKAEFARRVKNGRLGVVTGYSYPSERPLVTFPKDGRRPLYMFGAIDVRDWEVVELPGSVLA